VWLSTTEIFSVFAGYFFGNFRDKLKSSIINSDKQAKLRDLNDVEWLGLFRVVFAPVSLASDRAIFENNGVKLVKIDHIISVLNLRRGV